MKKRSAFRYVVLITLIMALSLLFVACEDTSSDVLRKQTEGLMQQSADVVGMPAITNFTEKKILKDIYELCDDADLITHLYIQNAGQKLIYIGSGIGYGVPYSTQFSASETLTMFNTPSGYTREMAPLAEPNGVFKADGMTATWYIMINEKGEREVQYWEPTIIVTQTKLPRRLCEEYSLPADY